MAFVLAAEFSPLRIDSVLSLQKSISGWRWTKLKKMIIEKRGARCEICGSAKGTLHAHEVWEYVNAADTGLDPEGITKAISKWQAEAQNLHAKIRPIFLQRKQPMTAALRDIQLLCQPCHVCKHSYDAKYMKHWCRIKIGRASCRER